MKNPDDELAVQQSTDLQDSAEKASNENDSDGKQTPTKSPRTKSPKSPKSKSPTGKKLTQAQPQVQAVKKGKKTPDSDEAGKKKIPLVPRRPSSQDAKDPKKSKAKPKGNEEASPPPPEDLDEKLVFDAYKTAWAYVNGIVSGEVAILTADEVQNAPVVEDPKGKKASKARTPSAKKKAESPKGKAKGKKDEPAQPGKFFIFFIFF